MKTSINKIEPETKYPRVMRLLGSKYPVDSELIVLFTSPEYGVPLHNTTDSNYKIGEPQLWVNCTDSTTWEPYNGPVYFIND